MSCYLNILQLHATYIYPKEDSVIENILDEGQQIVNTSMLNDMIVAALQNREATEYLKHLVMGYYDIKYFTALFLARDTEQRGIC